MLSILIPTYGYNTFPLVSVLHKQCIESSIEFEILVQDDASNSELNNENQKINSLSNCRFFENEKNLGRAENRNLLASRSTKKWLLFMDSDMLPTDKNFIKNYIAVFIKNQSKVIYGGIKYYDKKPAENQMLRWKYGTKREAKSIENRLQNPTFALTSNLSVLKTVFDEVKFDNSIKNYGNEDLIFTSALQKKNIEITQIDNNAYHLNLESSVIFLKKIETSLETLFSIYSIDKTKVSTQITKYYTIIEKYKLTFLVLALFNFVKNRITKNVLSANPSLFLFDMYRLGYFCSLK